MPDLYHQKVVEEYNRRLLKKKDRIFPMAAPELYAIEHLKQLAGLQKAKTCSRNSNNCPGFWISTPVTTDITLQCSDHNHTPTKAKRRCRPVISNLLKNSLAVPCKIDCEKKVVNSKAINGCNGSR